MAITTQAKAIDTVKKKKGERADLSKMFDIQVEPGDNTHYLSHALEIGYLPDIDTHSIEAIERRTREYFSICIKNDMKPSIAGYALALGMSRQNLFNILTGKVKRPAPIIDALKRATSIINAGMEDYMQNGKINPASGIFLMKNNMGYKDETEVILSPGEGKKSLEELTAEAAMLPEPEEG